MVHRVGRLRLLAVLTKCAADTAGVTAIEYALILGIIVIVVVSLVNGIGASVSGMISSVTPHL
jgi:Flp pilus assembly pilin Flp